MRPNTRLLHVRLNPHFSLGCDLSAATTADERLAMTGTWGGNSRDELSGSLAAPGV